MKLWQWCKNKLGSGKFVFVAEFVVLMNDIRNASSLSSFCAKLKTLFYCCVLKGGV